MLMSVEYAALKKFRRTPWSFQLTFHTPLQLLDSFTAAILDSLGDPKSGTILIDAVVMQPSRLETLLCDHRLPHHLQHGSAIQAESPAELLPLLTAAFGDWVDFLFIPSPKPFVLYADHDEYTTFYANSRSNLNTVVAALTTHGFQAVPNYIRASSFAASPSVRFFR